MLSEVDYCLRLSLLRADMLYLLFLILLSWFFVKYISIRELLIYQNLIVVVYLYFFIRNVAGGTFSKTIVENHDITLKEILNRTIAKRKDMVRIIGK